MEVLVACDLLSRVLDAARGREAKAVSEFKAAGARDVRKVKAVSRLEMEQAKDVKAVSDFQARLQSFVRSEISRFRDLQDEVYQEIRQWGEENVGTGRSYPKSFLFPRDERVFKRVKRRADEAIAAIEERQKVIKK